MSLNLTVKEVRKDYGSRPILDGCSYIFERTGVYVLTGHNGSGKSTLLRICALLEEPDAGAVSYAEEGRPVVHDIALRQRITLLLPRIGIFNTTVLQNVRYGLKIRGVKPKESLDRALEALDFVGLGDKRERHARTLSSGEAQRMGLARALVVQPEILFLDEPTASVDRKNTAQIEEIITRLNVASKTMVIMTTHDHSQAERLADVRIVMADGRIVAE